MSALLAEDRYPEPQDEAVQQVLLAFDDLSHDSRQAALRRAVEVAVAYERTRDLAPVVRFIDSLLMTARLHRNPRYEKALAEAPETPDLSGARDVSEIVEQLRKRAASLR